jgi:glycoside/pentoside/hexuronide:cation symporter, GPH family
MVVWPLTTAQLSLPLVAPCYAQTFGLTIAFAGLILTLGRLFDVAADVAVAWCSDRTRTRWGRRKPWVVAGLLLYVPACLLLFVPPADVSPARYAVTVMLYFLAWTSAFIPFLAQGTELSDDYGEKNRISVLLSAVMLIALLSAFAVPLLVVDSRTAFVRSAVASAVGTWLPDATTSFLRSPAVTGPAYYERSMLIITALALTPLLIALPMYLMKVREPPLATSVGHGSLVAAMRNPVFLRFAVGYAFLMAGYMGRGGLMPIILTHTLNLPDSYLFFMMIMFSSSLLVTPLWARLLRRYERIRCIILAALLECIGLALLFCIPSGNVALTIVAFVVMGLPGQTLLLVPYLVAADASDYSRWKTRSDSRAIHISLTSLIVKLGTVFAGLSIWLAGLVGLDLNRPEQSASIVWFVKIIGLGLPVLCLAIGCVVVAGFPLTRARHAAVLARLRRRDRRPAS